jgi:hypothetical protein
MERDTVGKVSSELLQGDTQSDHSAGEQMAEQLSAYESNIFDCVERGKTCFSGDFFVVVNTKRERLMPNVLRNYFFPRLSCPTPTYDQTVYHYARVDDRVEFLWVIPCQQTCVELYANRMSVDPSVSELLQFVLNFMDGTLDSKARILNKEIV